MNNYLNTFVLVNKDRVISPVLTTTREYGEWLGYLRRDGKPTEPPCKGHTYQGSTKTGEQLLEKHPGTRLGEFFKKTSVQSNAYKSWFAMQDSDVMDRLVKLKLAEYKDAIPISVNDIEGRRMIRLYTIMQIELYVQMRIDKSFKIDKYITVPKQVKISDAELEKLIKPEVDKVRKKLF